MQKSRMKKIVSSFLPLFLLVTLMQAIPVVFPKINLEKSNALSVTLTSNMCSTSSTLGSPANQGPSTACDNNSSTVFVSNDESMNLTINTGALVGGFRAISFTSGSDDSPNYRSRMIASATVYGCSNSAFSICSTTIGTATWSKSYLDSLGNNSEYTPFVFPSGVNSQYFKIITTSYGSTYGLPIADHGCSVSGSPVRCVQVSEVTLYKSVTVGNPFNSTPLEVSNTTTPVSSSVRISFNSSDSGTYYILVYKCPSNVCSNVTGANAPTAQTVISQPAISGNLIAKGTGNAVVGANSINFTGLEQGIRFVFFPVVVGAGGLVSDIITTPNNFTTPYLSSMVTNVSPLVYDATAGVNYTGTQNITVTYSLQGVGVGPSSIKIFYSTSSNLSNPSECGVANNVTVGGSTSCTLGASDGRYFLYSRVVDSNNSMEAVPSGSDLSITLDATGPVLSSVSISNLTHAAAKLNYTSNEKGTYFFRVQQESSSDPRDSASFVSGNLNNGSAISLTSRECGLGA